MFVVWKSFTALEMCAAFFVMAPLYSCWDGNVLAVQNIGVLVPFLCLWELVNVTQDHGVLYL